MLDPRECANKHCVKEFTPKSKKHKYCSAECRPDYTLYFSSIEFNDGFRDYNGRALKGYVHPDVMKALERHNLL